MAHQTAPAQAGPPPAQRRARPAPRPTYDRDTVLAAVSLPDLLDDLVGPGRGSGTQRKWPCPHPGHEGQTGRTPPVNVFTTSGGEVYWHCHACSAGGSIFDLIMLTQGVEYADALAFLAERAGVPPLTGAARGSGSPRASRLTGPPRAPQPRPETSAPTPPSEEVVDALTAYVVEAQAELYSGAAWADEVLRLAKARGWSKETLQRGMVGAHVRGIPACPGFGSPVGPSMVFPVTDAAGDLRYLQSRPIAKESRIKYLNPTADAITNPCLGFFGPADPETGIVVVAEGIPDALSAIEVGFSAVAVIGAGVAQGTQSRRMARELAEAFPTARIVLGFDGDHAGTQATDAFSAALIAAGAGGRTHVLAVPAYVAEQPKDRDLNAWLLRPGGREDLPLAIREAPAIRVPEMALAASVTELRVVAGGGGVPDYANAQRRCTDLGNAERLADLHGSRFRFRHGDGAWLVWQGSHWAADHDGAIQRAAAATVRTIMAEAAVAPELDARERLAKHAIRSESAARIAAMISLAQALPAFAVTSERLDRDPWLLACLNGTLDLRTGVLRPADPADLITRCTGVDYDPAASSQLWQRFLGEVTQGRPAIETYLQRVAGYTLTGLTEAEIVLYIQGRGGSGKSTFVDAVAGAMGGGGDSGPSSYVATARIDTFLEQQRSGSSATSDLHRLRDARLVLTGEPGQRQRLDAGLLKSLTGGDAVTARGLYRGEETFRPKFKLWMVANYELILPDDDDATWRRIQRVPFDHKVAPGAAR